MDTMAREFGVAKSIPPHLTYHLGEYATAAALPAALEQLAAGITAFEVAITGFGVFTGPKPVLYLTVVRGPCLVAVHEAIGRLMDGLGLPNHSFYAAPAWVPHVTLAIQHVSREAFPTVAAWLRDQDLQFRAQVDNLVLAREGGESIVVLGSYPLREA